MYIELLTNYTTTFYNRMSLNKHIKYNDNINCEDETIPLAN